MKIAVIHHAANPEARIGIYVIADLCRAFEAVGHEVVHLSGHSGAELADIALLHVDLSVVPDAYLALGRRYPILLNGAVSDIRKRRVSQALLRPDEAWDGPVIVKSDLNHGGEPERRLRRQLGLGVGEGGTPGGTPAPSPDYRLYRSAAEVPLALRASPDFVVEKFLPERESGFFHVRQAFFFGNRCISWRVRGHHPIIRMETIVDDVMIPTPREVLQYRRQLGLDYGKIDYVEHNGEIVIFDVNKTIGGSGSAPQTVAWLAPGIAAIEGRVKDRAV